MPVAVEIDLAGVAPENYEKMIALLGPSLATAPGFMAHAASPTEKGVRLVEIWQSEKEWGQYAQEKVAPLAQSFGMSVPQPRIQQLQRAITAHENDGGPTVPAVLLGAHEGESFRLGPLEIIVKEDGTRSRQKLAVAEFRGKGYRIPPHTHTEHDENIFVLEGPIGVQLGDKTFTAQTGDSFTIPVGVVHCMWNESDKVTRFLNIIAPAHYLTYFREMALAAAQAKGLPPKEVAGPIMRKFGLIPA